MIITPVIMVLILFIFNIFLKQFLPFTSEVSYLPVFLTTIDYFQLPLQGHQLLPSHLILVVIKAWFYPVFLSDIIDLLYVISPMIMDSIIYNDGFQLCIFNQNL